MRRGGKRILKAKPFEREFGGAEFLNVLSARPDIFEIEGNRSLYLICLLALLFGLGMGFGLRLAPRARVPAQLLVSPVSPQANAVQFSQPEEEQAAAEINSPLPGQAVRFFLPAKRTASPQKPKKRAPASSFRKNAAHPAPAPATRLAQANTVPVTSRSASFSGQIVTPRVSAPPIQKTELVAESESALLRRADQMKKRSDSTGAFAIYRRILAQNPRNDEALGGMGDLFRASGQYDSAVNFYRAALTVNPKNSPVHDGLGTALYDRSKRVLTLHYAQEHHIPDPARYMDEQYDSAISEYTTAFSLDSNNVDALTNRGVLRDLNNQHAAAIQDYSLAIRLKPASADAYSKRAGTYRDLGRYDAAIADYTAAIRLDSTSYEFDPTIHFANAYFGRGLTYYKMRKLARAISDFDSTLMLSPEHSLAYISKGVAWADESKYDSAIAAYSQAIILLTPKEYNGARMLAFLQRGNSWKALGKYDTAIADYRNAMASYSLAAKACWRIAECFCYKKDAADALTWLKKSQSYQGAEVEKWRRDRELSLLWSTPEFKELTRE